MQNLRSWLAKGVAALALASAFVIAAAHLNAVQAAPAHAAIVPAHESHSLIHTAFAQPAYLASNACITPLAGQVHATGLVTALAPFSIVHPSLAQCMLPLHVTFQTNNAFIQQYLNVSSQLTLVQK